MGEFRGPRFRESPVYARRQEELATQLRVETLTYFKGLPGSLFQQLPEAVLRQLPGSAAENVLEAQRSDLVKFGNSLLSLHYHELKAVEVMEIMDCLADALPQLPKNEYTACIDLVIGHFDIFEENLLKNQNYIKGEQPIRLLQTMAALPVRPSVKLMDMLEAKIITDITRGKARVLTLISTLAAFDNLQIPPSPAIMAAWQQRAIEMMPEFRGSNIADTLAFFVNMRMAPDPAFMSALEKRLAQALPKTDEDLARAAFMRPADLAVAFRSLAALEALGLYEGAEEQGKKVDAALRPLDPVNFRNGTIHQIHVARRWFQMDHTSTAPEFEPGHRSKMEMYLEDVLRHDTKANVAPETYTIAPLKHEIDITINDKATGKPEAFIEVDGPTHFLFRADAASGTFVPYTVNGKTAFQSAMIRMHEPDKPLLRVPFWVIDKMQASNGSGWSRIAAAELLRKIKLYGTGAYFASVDDGDNIALEDIAIGKQRFAVPPAASKPAAPEPVTAAAKPPQKNTDPFFDDGRYTPVTLEMVEGLELEDGLVQGTSIILPNVRNHMRRAGFALSSEIMTPPGVPKALPRTWEELLAIKAAMTPLQRLRHDEGYRIAKESWGLSDKELWEKWGVYKLPVSIVKTRQSAEDAALENAVARLQPAQAAANDQTDAAKPAVAAEPPPEGKKAVIAYFGKEAFFNGASDYFRNVWENVMPQPELLSMRELIGIMGAMATNINKAVYPENKVEVLDYIATHLDTWEALLTDRLPSAKKGIILDVLKIFQAMEIRPSAQFCALLQKCAARNLKNFTPQDLYEAAYAMAELGIEPTESFAASWAEQAREVKIHEKSSSSPNNQHLSAIGRTNLFWACAVMHATSGNKELAKLGTMLHTSIQRENVVVQPGYKHPRRMTHACLWFDLPLLGPVPQNRKNDGVFISRMQRIFSKAVSGEIAFGREIPTLKRSADVAFKNPATDNGHEVLVQVDGPQYAVRRAGATPTGKAASGLNGFGMLQSAVICKAEQQITLFRIVGDMGLSMLSLDAAAQEAIAARIVAEASSKTRGAYTLVFNEAGDMSVDPVPLPQFAEPVVELAA